VQELDALLGHAHPERIRTGPFDLHELLLLHLEEGVPELRERDPSETSTQVSDVGLPRHREFTAPGGFVCEDEQLLEEVEGYWLRVDQRFQASKQRK
jgi:hypothetical protein